MKLNFKFTTTAAFLISALLFAGCAGNAAPEESIPPETASPAPFSESDISSGIQTGADAEAASALLGVWELDKAEIKSEEKEGEYVPADVENTRTYTFNDDGTGTMKTPEWTAVFDYAVQGEYITFVLDYGALEMYQATFTEDGALVLVRINNDGTLQDLRETFVQPGQ